MTPDQFMADRLVQTLTLETIEMVPWLAGLLLVAYFHAHLVSEIVVAFVSISGGSNFERQLVYLPAEVLDDGV